MKIACIEVYQLDLPYSGGRYQLSGNRHYEQFDATIVCIKTTCGIEGWGESTPFGSTYIAAHATGIRAAIANMAPSLLGKDPRLVDRLNESMDQALAGQLSAKAAIDVACWDIWGQQTNMPVCDLLGGSTQQPLALISSIAAAEPEVMRQQVQQFRQRGYRGHSIKITATEDVNVDAERICCSLADAQCGEYFLVDANGGLTTEQALRLLRLLPKGLDFVLEAPCATWAETLALRQRSSVPMMLDELLTDETSLMMAITQSATDSVGLKISKNGGLTRCRRQRDIAMAAGLPMSVQDTIGSEIAFAAIVHLAQTIPTKYLRCILDTRAMVKVKAAQLCVQQVEQGIIAGCAPGLGLTIDRQLLGEPVMRFA